MNRLLAGLFILVLFIHHMMPLAFAQTDPPNLDQAKVMSFLDQQRKIWPLPRSQSQKITMGTPPNVKGMCRLRRFKDQELLKKFEMFLETHPLQDLVKELREAIKNKELVILFRPVPARLAFFAMEYDIPQEVDKALVPNKYFGVIAIDATQFAGLEDAKEVLKWMAGLYHEFQHFLDYKNAASEKAKLMFVQTGQRPVMDEFWCSEYWKTEQNAHRKECKLNIQWGMKDEVESLCDMVDQPKEFDQILWYLFVHQKGTRMAECVPIWAKFAGHPHPEQAKLF